MDDILSFEADITRMVEDNVELHALVAQLEKELCCSCKRKAKSPDYQNMYCSEACAKKGFFNFCKSASEEVAKWPAWKRNALGI